MNTLHSFRRSLVVCAVGVLATVAVRAQEVLPREEALKYAFAAALHEPSSMAAPIQVDADLKRPFVAHQDDYGVMVLPETKLAAMLSGAAKDVVPVGQLWLRRLTPLVQGSGVGASELQLVRVEVQGESERVPLCLMGARKTEAGTMELVVYGRNRTPLLAVPLRPTTRSQSLPVEIAGERESDGGLLRIYVLGKYVAELPVTELSDY